MRLAPAPRLPARCAPHPPNLPRPPDRNPQFKNEKKTVEPHLLAELADFYGAELRLVVTGFLRPEAAFSSMDALIAAIHNDIAVAREAMNHPPHVDAREAAFLRG